MPLMRKEGLAASGSGGFVSQFLPLLPSLGPLYLQWHVPAAAECRPTVALQGPVRVQPRLLPESSQLELTNNVTLPLVARAKTLRPHQDPERDALEPSRRVEIPRLLRVYPPRRDGHRAAPLSCAKSCLLGRVGAHLPAPLPAAIWHGPRGGGRDLR